MNHEQNDLEKHPFGLLLAFAFSCICWVLLGITLHLILN